MLSCLAQPFRKKEQWLMSLAKDWSRFRSQALWHCSCLPASEAAFANAGKARDPKDRRRVLILMSDTGGGHRASAEVNLLLLDSFFDPWQLPHIP